MKKTPRFRILLFLLVCSVPCFTALQAQSFLFGYPNIGGGGAIISINLNTCEETVISTITQSGNFTDFVMMPNGAIYLLGFSGSTPAVLLLDAPAGTWTVQTVLASPPQGGGMLALSDSTILISTLDNFYIYNTNTNVATNIGSIPGFTGFGEMFEYNGQIYITQTGGGNYPSGTYILNLSPLTLTPTPLQGEVFTSICNKVISPNYPVGVFNMTTGTINPLCETVFIGGGGGFGSTAPNLLNATGPLCDCTTDAGTWSTTPSVIRVCSSEQITLPHSGNEVLDGDDNLVFVLVDGNILNNYPNNILGVFDDPVISFLPGVTEFNTIYLVYAIAANALGSGIDYSDPCRYILNDPFGVEWVSDPAVSFTPVSENCTTGCQTIQATFTGSGPFSLTYEVSTIAGVIGTFTQSSNGQNSNINVCPPPGYSGPLTIQATAVSNAACTCN
jgi:hypothetical protein